MAVQFEMLQDNRIVLEYKTVNRIKQRIRSVHHGFILEVKIVVTKGMKKGDEGCRLNTELGCKNKILVTMIVMETTKGVKGINFERNSGSNDMIQLEYQVMFGASRSRCKRQEIMKIYTIN